MLYTLAKSLDMAGFSSVMESVHDTDEYSWQTCLVIKKVTNVIIGKVGNVTVPSVNFCLKLCKCRFYSGNNRSVCYH